MKQSIITVFSAGIDISVQSKWVSMNNALTINIWKKHLSAVPLKEAAVCDLVMVLLHKGLANTENIISYHLGHSVLIKHLENKLTTECDFRYIATQSPSFIRNAAVLRSTLVVNSSMG